MTADELIAKIAQLGAERDNFRDQANKQMGLYNGQIMVYQQLLAELSTPPQSTGIPDNKNSDGSPKDAP